MKTLLTLTALALLTGCATLDLIRDRLPEWPRPERPEQPAPDVPEPETPRPPATDDEAFFRSVRWLRNDPAAPNARVTKSFANVRLNGNRLTFDPLDVADWPSSTIGADLKGIIAVAALRDGQWTGGKFEHIRHRMTLRDLGNIHGGYIPGFSLRRGEALRFWIVSYDGREASNVVEVIWQ